LAVVVVGLLGFGVFVFTTEGPRPALETLSEPDGQPRPGAGNQQQASQSGQPSQPGQPNQQPPDQAANLPANLPIAATTTPEAAARFDAWARPLRAAGLTVTAKSIVPQGETLGIAELAVEGPDQLPRWRWTVQNASVFDKEASHLQAAGDTTITLTTAPDARVVWSGRVDAFGIALQKDPRDVLSRSVIFRVNGLSLAGAGDAAPLTLSDGQLRLFIGGGTGLLPQGAKATLRLMDMDMPAAAGAAVGTRVKSFTTEFGLNQKLVGLSFPEVLGLFESGANGIRLGTVALDWGTLHFIGDGELEVGRTGVLEGRLNVKVTDILPFLDAISATGGADTKVLAETYAAALLEMRADPPAPLPFTIAIKDGTIVLEGASRGLADITLGAAPAIITGVSQGQ
jgi:hypothetical protein